jgi:hypothetical protein
MDGDDLLEATGLLVFSLEITGKLHRDIDGISGGLPTDRN